MAKCKMTWHIWYFIMLGVAISKVIKLRNPQVPVTPTQILTKKGNKKRSNGGKENERMRKGRGGGGGGGREREEEEEEEEEDKE